jgi:hypothetical protein
MPSRIVVFACLAACIGMVNVFCVLGNFKAAAAGAVVYVMVAWRIGRRDHHNPLA